MSEPPTGEPRFFVTPADFRVWLAEHHATAPELLVGFHKRGSGRPSISWPESVDQALCYGWIDGVRRSLGAESYTIRFTPRRAGSHWSAVNVAKMAELTAAGLVDPAGAAVFAARSENRTAQASYERAAPAELTPQEDAAFRAEPVAWEWFCGQAPWYRRTALHWVDSAKRPQTRAGRLSTLIERSREGRRIG
jgi:uncharacterized protein YdeI (YjbR/CyaY-like superfamily)